MKRWIALCLLTWGLLLGADHRSLTWGLLYGTDYHIQPQGGSARDELLGLVPADAGFCLSLQNLREESEKWGRSPWFTALRASPLGQAIAHSPEMRRLVRFNDEMQKRFGIDWAKLRDDVFGDAVVFAYWPPLPGRPEQEQGLLLLRARRADLLKQFIDRVNVDQLKSKEVKRIEERQYHGIKYQLRAEQHKDHFLLVDGNFLAFTSKESLIKWTIDRRQGNTGAKNIIAQQVNRAGAERALAALWINPRAFDAELQEGAKAPPPVGPIMQSFLTYWKPLDVIVLSANVAEDFELRLAIQARINDLPASAKRAFTEPSKPAEIWNRFPEDAILRLAGQIDPTEFLDVIGDFLSPDHRKVLLGSLQKFVGTAIKMDVAKDVLPNIGPDWGMFIAQGRTAKDTPDMLFALAVKPGAGTVKVDRALLEGINFLALVAVYANSDLAIDKVVQDKVEVHFLTGAKVFPQGMRPAWALKDGYLVFASSPEAILRLRAQKTSPQPAAHGEVPVLMLSTVELAKLLRGHRENVIDYLTQNNRDLHKDAANQTVEDVLRMLDLIQQITFSHGSGNGQLTWTLRLRPRIAN